MYLIRGGGREGKRANERGVEEEDSGGGDDVGRRGVGGGGDDVGK